MTNRRSIALMLGLLTSLALPAAARADEVTLNVPVQLTNIAANVTRGRVQCLVIVDYQGARGATGGATGRARVETFRGESAEFGFDASGAYNGTAVVRVQVAPPRELVEAMVPITVGTRPAPSYVCDIQVAMPGGDFHPQRPRESASGQATGRLQGPEWSLPRGGSNPSVNGQLQVTQPGQPR